MPDDDRSRRLDNGRSSGNRHPNRLVYRLAWGLGRTARMVTTGSARIFRRTTDLFTPADRPPRQSARRRSPAAQGELDTAEVNATLRAAEAVTSRAADRLAKEDTSAQTSPPEPRESAAPTQAEEPPADEARQAAPDGEQEPAPDEAREALAQVERATASLATEPEAPAREESEDDADGELEHSVAADIDAVVKAAESDIGGSDAEE